MLTNVEGIAVVIVIVICLYLLRELLLLISPLQQIISEHLPGTKSLRWL